MVNTEKLLAIEDLKIAEKLKAMNQGELDEYIQVLERFIENFPRYEANIKEVLEDKDFDAISEELQGLQKALIKVGADDIAAECQENVNNYTTENLPKFESYVAFMLSQLSALSIDIQMALYKDEEKKDEPAAAASPASTASASPAPAAASGKTILAVDDDPQCLDIFKLALSGAGCKIIAVTSGPAAMGIIKKQNPDLLVFDIDMPIMDGIKLANNVRESGCKTPIVFITGNSQKDVVVRALKAGGSDFILKPINPLNVVSRISKFI